MNKREFLNELKKGLAKLPELERNDILRDYEEHFFSGLENNLTEPEISKSLGNPKQIANDILTSYNIKHSENRNIFRGTIATISLLLFNLIFMLGPVISFFAILFSLWVVSISLIIQLLVVIISLVIYPGQYFLFEFFVSLGAFSLGILLLVTLPFLTKKSLALFTLYVKKNIEIITGGKKYEPK